MKIWAISIFECGLRMGRNNSTILVPSAAVAWTNIKCMSAHLQSARLSLTCANVTQRKVCIQKKIIISDILVLPRLTAAGKWSPQRTVCKQRLSTPAEVPGWGGGSSLPNQRYYLLWCNRQTRNGVMTERVAPSDHRKYDTRTEDDLAAVWITPRSRQLGYKKKRNGGNVCVWWTKPHQDWHMHIACTYMYTHMVTCHVHIYTCMCSGTHTHTWEENEASICMHGFTPHTAPGVVDKAVRKPGAEFPPQWVICACPQWWRLCNQVIHTSISSRLHAWL